jgi:predicted phosphodiesterase
VWEADFKHKIKVWTFGHTHFTYDFVEEGIRFVCNPRGYGGERWKNSQRHILQIDTDDLSGSAFGDI